MIIFRYDSVQEIHKDSIEFFLSSTDKEAVDFILA